MVFGTRPRTIEIAIRASEAAAASAQAIPDPERFRIGWTRAPGASRLSRIRARSSGLGATDGAPTWQAQCEDGGAHVIVVKPDGTAVVVSGTRP